MAERELSVILKLGGMEEGARKTAAYADANKKAAASVDGLTDAERRLMAQQRQMAAAGAGGSPVSAAQRWQAVSMREQQGYQRQMLAPEAGGGYMPGIPGSLKAALGVSALAAGFGGIGRQLTAFGEKPPLSRSEAFESISSEFIKAVPIIGQFAQALGGAKDYLSGFAHVLAKAQNDLELRGQRSNLNNQIGQLQFEGLEQVRGGVRNWRQARSSRMATENLMGSLTPADMASFGAVDQFGSPNYAPGEARFGKRLAEASAAAAAENVAEAQRQFDKAQSDPSRVAGDIGVAFAQGRANRAQKDVAEMERRRLDALRNPGRENDLMFTDERVYKRELGVAAGKAGQAQIELSEKINQQALKNTELEKRRAELLAEQNALAQRRAEIGARQLDIDKADLDIVRDKVQRSKSGFGQAGMAAPGELESVLATKRQAEQFGFGSLSPEQKALLAGNQFTANFANQQAITVGQQNPAAQTLAAEAGLGNLQALEAQAARGAEDIRRALLSTQAEQQKAIEEAAALYAKGLGEAVVKGLAGKFDQLKAELLLQIDQKILQGGRGGP